MDTLHYLNKKAMCRALLTAQFNTPYLSLLDFEKPLALQGKSDSPKAAAQASSKRTFQNQIKKLDLKRRSDVEALHPFL